MPVSNLTERAKIQRVVNGVYADICAKSDWWWLLRKASTYTLAKDASGLTLFGANPGLTVSLTFGSATATLSSAPVATTLAAGTAIWFTDATGDARQGVYRVLSSYVSGVTLPLDGPYGGPTASGVTFEAQRDSLTFADDAAKILRITRYGATEDLKKIGIEEMARLKQWDKSQGRPQAWSVYDFGTANDPSTRRRIWIHPYPDDNYRLDIWYKYANTQDTSVDLDLPMDFQQVLIYGALARGYPIFMNDPERGSFFQGLFNDVMALMAAQQREYASDHPGVATDMRAYRQTSNRRRWPGRSLGRYFDILPYQP